MTTNDLAPETYQSIHTPRTEVETESEPHMLPDDPEQTEALSPSDERKTAKVGQMRKEIIDFLQNGFYEQQ